MSPTDMSAEEKHERNSRARWRALLVGITQSTWIVVVLAIAAALIVANILTILADEEVAQAARSFGSDPGAFFAAAGTVVANTYEAIFRGAIFNPQARSVAAMFKPFTETLTISTPLILAGLGLGVGFRAGLFNIGAQGQMIIGATLGAYVGFAWHLPWGIHLFVALCGAALGGALWGFIPGLLKATTGAHEVITTIMLNYIALQLVSWLLSLESFQRPGQDFPKSPLVDSTAELPLLLSWIPGGNYRLHLGFLIALAAAWGVWWLMERSTWGFRFRAIGANPHAAITAGMNVKRGTIAVMTVAGLLAGVAGGSQARGTERALTADVAGSFGFDAITVALLGRSRPLGTVLAALLFGALRAAGPTLQVQAQVPPDIVLVVQSLIVLFIAAPPLVRFLFRMPPVQETKEVTA